MEGVLAELFLDSANEYEIKQKARDMRRNNLEKINMESMLKWAAGQESISISSIVERNNIMYVLDDLNRAYIKSITSTSNSKPPVNFSTLAADYYNPYEGSVDISKVSAPVSDFDTAGFLDRTNSAYYKKNKSTKFKCMNARLNTISTGSSKDMNNITGEEVESEIENNYYLTKKLKISI